MTRDVRVQCVKFRDPTCALWPNLLTKCTQECESDLFHIDKPRR